MTDLMPDETVDAYTVLQAAFDSVVESFDPFSAEWGSRRGAVTRAAWAYGRCS